MKKNVCKSMLTVSLVASMIGSVANADVTKVSDDCIKVKEGESIYLTSESQEDKGEAIARLRFDSESQAQTEYGLDTVAKEQMKERLIKCGVKRGLDLADKMANQSVDTALAEKKKCIADALSAIKDEFNYDSMERFKYSLEEAIRLGGINSDDAKLYSEFVEEFETIVDVLNSIDREYGIDYTNRVNTATGLNNAQSEAADRAGKVLNAKKDELFSLVETINHKYGSVEDLKDLINKLKLAKKTNPLIDENIVKDLDNMIEEYETLCNVFVSFDVDEGLNEMNKEAINRVGYNNVKIGLNNAKADANEATKDIVSDKIAELLDKTNELNKEIDRSIARAEKAISATGRAQNINDAKEAEEELKSLDDAKNTLATIVGDKAREIASANEQKRVVEYDHSSRGQAEEDAKSQAEANAKAQARFEAESVFNTATGLKKAEADAKDATKDIVSDKIAELLDKTKELNKEIDTSIANSTDSPSASGRAKNINDAKEAEEKLKSLDDAKNTLATMVGDKARKIASVNEQKRVAEAAAATRDFVAKQKVEPMRKAIEEFKKQNLRAIEEANAKIFEAAAPKYPTEPSVVVAKAEDDVPQYPTEPSVVVAIAEEDAEDSAAMQAYKQYQQGRVAGLGEANEKMVIAE